MKPVNNQIVDEMFPEPEGANFVDIEETSGETNVFIDLQTVHSDFHNCKYEGDITRKSLSVKAT